MGHVSGHFEQFGVAAHGQGLLGVEGHLGIRDSIPMGRAKVVDVYRYFSCYSPWTAKMGSTQHLPNIGRAVNLEMKIFDLFGPAGAQTWACGKIGCHFLCWVAPPPRPPFRLRGGQKRVSLLASAPSKTMGMIWGPKIDPFSAVFFVFFSWYD
jgi:hypothetical protein